MKVGLTSSREESAEFVFCNCDLLDSAAFADLPFEVEVFGLSCRLLLLLLAQEQLDIQISGIIAFDLIPKQHKFRTIIVYRSKLV